MCCLFRCLSWSLSSCFAWGAQNLQADGSQEKKWNELWGLFVVQLPVADEQLHSLRCHWMAVFTGSRTKTVCVFPLGLISPRGHTAVGTDTGLGVLAALTEMSTLLLWGNAQGLLRSRPVYFWFSLALVRYTFVLRFFFNCYACWRGSWMTFYLF